MDLTEEAGVNCGNRRYGRDAKAQNQLEKGEVKITEGNSNVHRSTVYHSQDMEAT